MTPHAQLLDAARAAGATVLETAAAIVVVIPVASSGAAPDDLIPLTDAAAKASTSVRLLKAAIRDGEIPVFGRQRYRAVRRGDLTKWIESRRSRPTEIEQDDYASRIERRAALNR